MKEQNNEFNNSKNENKTEINQNKENKKQEENNNHAENDHQNKNIKDIKNKKEICLLDFQFINVLVEDSKIYYNLNDTFNIFKSIDDILYLIYVNNNNSIIFYNIIDNKKINEIKNTHNDYITNFRHVSDNINQRDLLMSISAFNNNIKIWDINNLECILNIEKINKKNEYLLSACFLNNNNNIYIVTSSKKNDNISNRITEPIKVYDLNSKKVKTIYNSNYNTFYIDTYYDIKQKKNYIIAGNELFAISYDYEKNKQYQRYYSYNDIKKESEVYYIFIDDSKEITKLIESTGKDDIKVWDFHSGKFLWNIILGSSGSGFLLYNEYILIGYEEGYIKVKYLKSGINIKTLKAHKNKVYSIKKIYHPKYGECIISQSSSQIKLWKFNFSILNK